MRATLVLTSAAALLFSIAGCDDADDGSTGPDTGAATSGAETGGGSGASGADSGASVACGEACVDKAGECGAPAEQASALCDELCGQALEKAERMLALAEKAPKDSISQRSAAMQAHAEAVLAHQNAGFVLDAGPIAPSVRDNMAQTRRKAASVARQAQVIVGAEKRPRRRAQTPTPNPGRRRTAASTSSSAAERARRALRSL